MEINNDKVEKGMDEDLANMIRSDTLSMTIEAMNDNITDKIVRGVTIGIHCNQRVPSSFLIR